MGITSQAIWRTEVVHRRIDHETLTVRGHYSACDEGVLRRLLAIALRAEIHHVEGSPTHIEVTAPLGTYDDPTHYRALVDEAVFAAERETSGPPVLPPQEARTLVKNVVLLAAGQGMDNASVVEDAELSRLEAHHLFAGTGSVSFCVMIRVADALGVSLDALTAPAEELG